jgi:hypothetical protein
LIARPSNFISAAYATGGSPSLRASALRTRASNFSAPAAVVSVSVSIEHRADDPLCRRIGRDELGMGGLDRLQFLVQAVVLGVRNLRRIEHVIRLGVMEQDLAQLFGAGFRLARLARRPARRGAPLAHASLS